MNESILKELFLICIAIILFAVTIGALIAICIFCYWMISRMIDMIKGKRSHFFDTY